MSNLDIVIIALKNIKRNKVKFLLTCLSICVGISSVMIITTIGDIGKTLINTEVSSMGIDGLSITSKYSSVDLNIDLIEKINNNFEIVSAMPVVSTFASYDSKTENSQAVLWGVDDSLYQTLQVNHLFGEEFSQNDVNFSSKVAIIDETTANNIYKRTNVVGKEIMVSIDGKNEYFEIKAVISDQKAMLDSFFGEYSPSFIYIPYTLLQNIKGKSDLSQVAIRADGDLEELKENIEYYIDKNEKYSGNLSVQNISSYLDEIGNITGYVTIVLAFIAGISMIVAGIGVLNMMLSSTIERKKEIGIYMALGASNKNVGKIFLAESIGICLFSGVLGVIISLIIVYLGTIIVGVPFVINIRNIAIIELIAISCGVFAGIIPAKKASKMNPIDVLRE